MRNNEILVSVIIPVYNNGQYIDKCISTLLNQTIQKELLEVILINDGSKDDSLEKCNKYAQKYKFIKVIDKENGGVSSARNAGLDVAVGKYCMFLDADDYISENTVKDVSDYFEKHYEKVDIVVYNMIVVNELTGKETRHLISERFEETGIYDVIERPDLTQSTMNFMVKNNGERFNEKLFLAEDEEYVIRAISERGRVGFYNGATYFYFRNQKSASNSMMNPYYSGDCYLKYLENLVNKYQQDGVISPYIQGYIVKRLLLRVGGDNIYPYHLDKEKISKYTERLTNILSYVEVEGIRNFKSPKYYQKWFLLSLKGIKIETEIKENKLILSYKGLVVHDEPYATIRFTNVITKDDTVTLIGFLKTPYSMYVKPNIYLCTKSIDKIKKKRLDIKLSNHNQYGTKMVITNFYTFEAIVDLNKVDEIYFEAEFDDKKVNCDFEFKRPIYFNKKYRGEKVYLESKILRLNECKQKFIITPSRFTGVEKFCNHIQVALFSKKTLKHKIIYMFYRLFSMVKTKGEIWLYIDRNNVYDNAYYQFKYDITKKDTNKKYYIYDDDLKNIQNEFSKKELKYFVHRNSFKYKLLYLRADKVLTSFLPPTFYNPFNKNNIDYLGVIKADIIYLQHGILHAHTPWIYSKEKNDVSKIVVSSEFEKMNLINNYNYCEDDLIYSGMPRLDLLDKNRISENIIIYAPSWREELIGWNDANNRRKLYVDQFLASEFFKEANGLLTDEKFIKLLRDNKLKFYIKLHPIFKEYAGLFQPNGTETFVDDNIEIDKCRMFITDYSSFVFDYLWLERPILYFCPDDEKFRAGLHTYRKLDLPLEEGFGDISYNKDELIGNITHYVNSNFELKDKYRERIENFYTIKDNHRERLYQELIK